MGAENFNCNARVNASNPDIQLYIANSRKWYFDRYFHIYTDLTYLIIICIALSMSVTYAFGIIEKQNEVVDVPFCTYNNDTIRTYYKILSIADPRDNNNINDSLFRYLSGYYINLRESIPLEMLDDRYLDATKSRVGAISSIKVKGEYDRYIDGNSSSSPLSSLYQFKIYRVVNIITEKVKIIQHNDHPQCIIVPFQTFDFKDKKATRAQTKVAVINATFTDIKQILKDKIPLKFMITDYYSKNINNLNELSNFNSCILS